MRALLRATFFLLPVLLVGTAAVTTLSLQQVRSSTNTYRFSQEAVPNRRVGIVLGAGVRPGGIPSPILNDRLAVAIALYKEGKISKLLLTGDNGSIDYNEVIVMQRVVLEAGIPEDAIRLDYAGFSTYDSCYRAYHVFGVQEAVIITQRFHQPRAIFTCRSFGIDAVGVDIPDYERYPDLRYRQELREWLATVQAYWEVQISKPAARFPGPKEDPI